MNYLDKGYMYKNPRWASPNFWQSHDCHTNIVPFAFRAAMSHSIPIDCDRAFRRITIRDLRERDLQCLYTMVDKYTFYHAQWGEM